MASDSSRIEHPQILRLFPTFVWKTRLRQGVRDAIHADVLAAVDDLMRKSGGSNAAALWQSRHGLHTLPEFARLAACLREAAEQALDFLKIDHGRLRITGCWANVAAPGAFHGMHSHPNNFLSGVYYVQVQAGADTINFHDPRPQTGVIRPPVAELTAYNTDQVVVQVENGTLLIFPAWLPHSVPPNESRERRISVSFNAMFEGFAETMSAPLWGEE